MKRQERKLVKLAKREWVYVMRPRDYQIAGCVCGNLDPDWSEYRHMLWCQKCKRDFKPAHDGIFDGPVGVGVSELMGIYFDRIDLKTMQLLPDWEGKSHYMLGQP